MANMANLAQAPLVITPGTGPGGARVVDHYDLDDGDASHPIYIDYLIPASAAQVTKATLSWKLRAFRSTVNLNPSTVGTDTTGESGHSHSHGHTLAFQGSTSGNAVSLPAVAGQLFASGGGNDAGGTVQANAAGSSGHSHSHSHSLSGSASQAVTDGPKTTIAALLIDAVDYTATLGGPWTSDVIELDLTSVFKTSTLSWHTIQLSLAGLGRVTSLLRFYYAQ